MLRDLLTTNGRALLCNGFSGACFEAKAYWKASCLYCYTMVLAKKSTMVKDVVGHVKTSTYDLPAPSHTYGALVSKDPETAGQVISKWDVSKPSVAKTSDRDLIKVRSMRKKL
jgi:Domain of unknown function (DUF4483)